MEGNYYKATGDGYHTLNEKMKVLEMEDDNVVMHHLG